MADEKPPTHSHVQVDLSGPMQITSEIYEQVHFEIQKICAAHNCSCCITLRNTLDD